MALDDGKFDQILTRYLAGEALDAVLAGEVPDAAGTVREGLVPLLSVVTRVRETERPALSAAARARHEQALQRCASLRHLPGASATRRGRSGPASAGFRRQGRFNALHAAAAAAVTVVVLLAGGTLSATASSLPSSPLYPLKLAGERMQVTLSTSNAARARVYLMLAERRLGEAERLAQGGDVNDPTLVEELLLAAQDDIAQAMATIGAVPGMDGVALLTDLSGLVTWEQTLLESLLPALPLAEQPRVREALVMVRQDRHDVEQALRTRVAETLGQAAPPMPSPVAPATDPPATGATMQPARASSSSTRGGAAQVVGARQPRQEDRAQEPASTPMKPERTATALPPDATPTEAPTGAATDLPAEEPTLAPTAPPVVVQAPKAVASGPKPKPTPRPQTQEGAGQGGDRGQGSSQGSARDGGDQPSRGTGDGGGDQGVGTGGSPGDGNAGVQQGQGQGSTQSGNAAPAESGVGNGGTPGNGGVLQTDVPGSQGQGNGAGTGQSDPGQGGPQTQTAPATEPTHAAPPAQATPGPPAQSTQDSNPGQPAGPEGGPPGQQVTATGGGSQRSSVDHGDAGRSGGTKSSGKGSAGGNAKH